MCWLLSFMPYTILCISSLLQLHAHKTLIIDSGDDLRWEGIVQGRWSFDLALPGTLFPARPPSHSASEGNGGHAVHTVHRIVDSPFPPPTPQKLSTCHDVDKSTPLSAKHTWESANAYTRYSNVNDPGLHKRVAQDGEIFQEAVYPH